MPSIYIGDLLDLHVKWQSLINARVQYREGGRQRADLDNLYYQVLPIMHAIDEAIEDDERYRLIRKAIGLLTTPPIPIVPKETP